MYNAAFLITSLKSFIEDISKSSQKFNVVGADCDDANTLVEFDDCENSSNLSETVLFKILKSVYVNFINKHTLKDY